MIKPLKLFYANSFKLMFCLLSISLSATGVELKGVVTDLGEPSSSNRIAGVSLIVKDAKNKELSSSITNARGEYDISYTGERAPVKMVFEKLGFKALPTVRWISDPRATQAPVLLIRESATAEYYKNAAATVSDKTLIAPYLNTDDAAGAIASLSARDKSLVVSYLKSTPAEHILVAITTAEENIITERVKNALLADAELKGSEIKVETHKGTVQLSGFVASRDEIEKAKEVAKGASGATSVKNNIRIK